MNLPRISQLKILKFFLFMVSFNNFIGMESSGNYINQENLDQYKNIFLGEIVGFNEEYNKPIIITEIFEDLYFKQYKKRLDSYNFKINFEINKNAKIKENVLFVITFFRKSLMDNQENINIVKENFISMEFYRDRYVFTNMNQEIIDKTKKLATILSIISIILSPKSAEKSSEYLKEQILLKKNKDHIMSYSVLDYQSLTSLIYKVKFLASQKYELMTLINRKFKGETLELVENEIHRLYNIEKICEIYKRNPITIVIEKIREFVINCEFIETQYKLVIFLNNVNDDESFQISIKIIYQNSYLVLGYFDDSLILLKSYFVDQEEIFPLLYFLKNILEEDRVQKILEKFALNIDHRFKILQNQIVEKSLNNFTNLLFCVREQTPSIFKNNMINLGRRYQYCQISKDNLFVQYNKGLTQEQLRLHSIFLDKKRKDLIINIDKIKDNFDRIPDKIKNKLFIQEFKAFLENTELFLQKNTLQSLEKRILNSFLNSSLSSSSVGLYSIAEKQEELKAQPLKIEKQIEDLKVEELKKVEGSIAQSMEDLKIEKQIEDLKISQKIQALKIAQKIESLKIKGCKPQPIEALKIAQKIQALEIEKQIEALKKAQQRIVQEEELKKKEEEELKKHKKNQKKKAQQQKKKEKEKAIENQIKGNILKKLTNQILTESINECLETVKKEKTTKKQIELIKNKYLSKLKHEFFQSIKDKSFNKIQTQVKILRSMRIKQVEIKQKIKENFISKLIQEIMVESKQNAMVEIMKKPRILTSMRIKQLEIQQKIKDIWLLRIKHRIFQSIKDKSINNIKIQARILRSIKIKQLEIQQKIKQNFISKLIQEMIVESKQNAMVEIMKQSKDLSSKKNQKQITIEKFKEKILITLTKQIFQENINQFIEKTIQEKHQKQIQENFIKKIIKEIIAESKEKAMVEIIPTVETKLKLENIAEQIKKLMKLEKIMKKPIMDSIDPITKTKLVQTEKLENTMGSMEIIQDNTSLNSNLQHSITHGPRHVFIAKLLEAINGIYIDNHDKNKDIIIDLECFNYASYKSSNFPTYNISNFPNFPIYNNSHLSHGGSNFLNDIIAYSCSNYKNECTIKDLHMECSIKQVLSIITFYKKIHNKHNNIRINILSVIIADELTIIFPNKPNIPVVLWDFLKNNLFGSRIVSQLTTNPFLPYPIKYDYHESLMILDLLKYIKNQINIKNTIKNIEKSHQINQISPIVEATSMVKQIPMGQIIMGDPAIINMKK